jgi:hypothetical protein
MRALWRLRDWCLSCCSWRIWRGAFWGHLSGRPSSWAIVLGGRKTICVSRALWLWVRFSGGHWRGVLGVVETHLPSNTSRMLYFENDGAKRQGLLSQQLKIFIKLGYLAVGISFKESRAGQPWFCAKFNSSDAEITNESTRETKRYENTKSSARPKSLYIEREWETVRDEVKIRLTWHSIPTSLFIKLSVSEVFSRLLLVHHAQTLGILHTSTKWEPARSAGERLSD